MLRAFVCVLGFCLSAELVVHMLYVRQNVWFVCNQCELLAESEHPQYSSY